MDNKEVLSFQEQLRQTGDYRTPDGLAPAAADRILGRFDWWYYLRIIRIVVGAAGVARGGYPTPRYSRDSFAILRAAECCGGRVSIEGMHQLLTPQGPKVLVANHMSILETVILPCMLLSFGEYSTVVKKKLLEYPYFGTVLGATEPISVGRANPREDLETVLSQGTERLGRGRSVLLFPQSTRTQSFDAASFNSLGVKLARRAGAPVVPLAVKTDFNGIGKLIRDFGPVTRSSPIRFRCGSPLPVQGTGKDAHRAVVAFIADTLESWGVAVKREETPS